MTKTLGGAFAKNFLGNTPDWYKMVIIVFLILNPILMFTAGPFIAGWVLIAEFIFTLAMALKCYPLPAGGLLALQAVAIGMTSPASVYKETLNNFEVILLLIFMVAGIYFMKDFLQFIFTRILVRIQSKYLISLLFCFLGAFLSAFLDALTVTAVIIAVAYAFYNVYHRYASGMDMSCAHDLVCDSKVKDMQKSELQQFRAFLRNLMMHGAVGTALGGVCTLVGEPQNLLIAGEMGWSFSDFFVKVAPVSMPVLAVGLLTCFLVERFRLFTYGAQMPGNIRSHLL
jgi:NhaB family Na+:H+ antiporter